MNNEENSTTDTMEKDEQGLMGSLPIPKPSFMMVGFLVIAFVIGWLNLKQAQLVDASGDVYSVKAEMDEVRHNLSKWNDKKNDSTTKADEKEKLKGDIEKANNELKDLQKDLSAQSLDVKYRKAAILNGSWLWTLILQIGAGLFGIGVINLVKSRTEESGVRAAAVVVIGAIVIFMLFSRAVITHVIGMM